MYGIKGFMSLALILIIFYYGEGANLLILLLLKDRIPEVWINQR